MATSSLLTNIIMLVIITGIGYFYIYPTVGQIRENQDVAVTFATELTKVSAVNSQLQEKVTAINNVPLQDKQKLATYMPDTLDDVALMRTMESILIAVGIEPDSLAFAGGASDGSQNTQTDTSQEVADGVDSITVESTISISFETDEDTLYSYFAAVERSVVPFFLKNATLTPTEAGLVSADLTYTVFALAPATVSNSTNADNSIINDGMVF